MQEGSPNSQHLLGQLPLGLDPLATVQCIPGPSLQVSFRIEDGASQKGTRVRQSCFSHSQGSRPGQTDTLL